MQLLISLAFSLSDRISVFSCVSLYRCIHISVCMRASSSVAGPIYMCTYIHARTRARARTYTHTHTHTHTDIYKRQSKFQHFSNVYEAIELSQLFQIPRLGQFQPDGCCSGRVSGSCVLVRSLDRAPSPRREYLQPCTHDLNA
jgi:hypothetical protein